jgi:hypothetical protein
MGVQLPSADDAEDAIRRLDGIELNGRNVVVRNAVVKERERAFSVSHAGSVVSVRKGVMSRGGGGVALTSYVSGRVSMGRCSPLCCSMMCSAL